MADSVRIEYKELHSVIEAVFSKLSVPERDCSILADAMLLADLYGVESHGLQRLDIYVRGLKEGYMSPSSKYEIVKETPISMTIDGHHSLGQIMGHDAMGFAIKKAKDLGVGIVVVRNSNHIGMGGYYAKLASDEGLLGIALTNTRPIVVPTNGCRSMLGSNPIACAFPAEPFPFFLDVATSVVPLGKLEVLSQQGIDIPSGWAVDGNGNSVTDGAKGIADINNRIGGLLPLGGLGVRNGGHKGYGFSVLCELLTSAFSLGTPSSRIEDETMCQCYVAVNPAMFGDKEEIVRRFSDYLNDLRTSPSSDVNNKIITHGEKEYQSLTDRMANGIPVRDVVLVKLRNVAKELGVEVNF